MSMNFYRVIWTHPDEHGVCVVYLLARSEAEAIAGSKDPNRSNCEVWTCPQEAVDPAGHAQWWSEAQPIVQVLDFQKQRERLLSGKKPRGGSLYDSVSLMKGLESCPRGQDVQTKEIAALVAALKSRKKELTGLLSGKWMAQTYEECVYRLYHRSFLVFRVQRVTEDIVRRLKSLMPERELNAAFMQIIRDGTGKTHASCSAGEWVQTVRPILEAFFHAQYMLKMAIRYADMKEPPQPMPAGWAALLYLYNLRCPEITEDTSDENIPR